jgi:phage gp36-like protein
MPYATPQQVIQNYGLKEITQLLTDEQNLLTEQLLTDAIAGAWTGDPSAEDIAAAEAALERFTRKIETVSNFMDTYLQRAVTLPLSADDANIGTLNECCMALVRCGLSDDPDNATDRMDECCDKWRTWLKDVAKGTAQLVKPDGETLPTKSRVRSGQAYSRYNWHGHGGVQ